jgi:hypothetical protein
VSILSLCFAVKVYRLQRKSFEEIGNLSAEFNTTHADGRLRHRITIVFRNDGIAPITLNRLGLATAAENDPVLPKWPDNRPKIPVKLSQGERAEAIYFDDEKELDPRHRRQLVAVAVTASGKTLTLGSPAVDRWNSLPVNGHEGDRS